MLHQPLVKRRELLPLLAAIRQELRAPNLRWRFALRAGSQPAEKDQLLSGDSSYEPARHLLVGLSKDPVPVAFESLDHGHKGLRCSIVRQAFAIPETMAATRSG